MTMKVQLVICGILFGGLVACNSSDESGNTTVDLYNKISALETELISVKQSISQNQTNSIVSEPISEPIPPQATDQFGNRLKLSNAEEVYAAVDELELVILYDPVLIFSVLTYESDMRGWSSLGNQRFEDEYCLTHSLDDLGLRSFLSAHLMTGNKIKSITIFKGTFNGEESYRHIFEVAGPVADADTDNGQFLVSCPTKA